MQHSEQFAQVATALAAAQGAFPTIPRDRTVTVRTKKTDSNGNAISYTFAYAPLETILEKVRPPLASNGLALLQSVTTDDKGAEFVRTMLVHSSGEWFANEIPVFTSGADNASQGYASGLTYARRYGVTTLLVLAADEDDDGNGNEDGQRSQRPPPPQQGRAPSKPQQSAPAQPRAKDEPPQAEGEPVPLSAGPQRLLDAKAKAAGLTPAEVTQRFGTVHMGNLNETLRQLGELYSSGAQ